MNLCGCVSFLYCTFKHEYVSVYCKTQRGDRQTEKSATPEMYHPLKSRLFRNTSAHITNLSSPSCCYSYSHVQIKLHCRNRQLETITDYGMLKVFESALEKKMRKKSVIFICLFSVFFSYEAGSVFFLFFIFISLPLPLSCNYLMN